MNMDALTLPFSLRTLLLGLLVGVLSVSAGTMLTGCDAGGMNDDGDNFIAPSSSRVGWEVEPGTPDTTQQFTLTYNSLETRPTPVEVSGPFTLELVEETGTPSEGTSVFSVTFSPGDDITTFTEKVVFEAGNRYVTIQFFGFVGFNDTLITNYSGDGVISNDLIFGFNGIGSGFLQGQLTLTGDGAGGTANSFPGVVHVADAPIDFGETPVLVATMKVSAESETPAIVRAALNQADGLPDANSSVEPLIKTIPNDGEYRQYYFDFRDLFVQFDGQPVNPANISEIVFLVNDTGSLGALGRSDTFTGTIFVDRVARRPDIPGEDNGGGGGGGDTNQAPSASFTFEPSEPEIGTTVTFTDESTDPDGSIDSRDWDFGDGNTATGASPTNTYQQAGDYTVSLTVTDDDGATSTTDRTVTVIDPDAQPTSFRGDDDGDGQIIFDDFEDGIESGEYFQFSGSASISLAEGGDVPMESSGTISHVANIDGGAGGGFAGYGKGTGSDVPAEGIDVSALGADPYFTMFFKTDVTEAFTLEINLQEDQDGNGLFDGSGAVDDEFQYEYLVDPNETGYTRISIPFSAFADDNNVNSGGDGQLSDRIANVVFAIGGLPAEQFSFTVDDIIYSDTDLGSGGGGTANATACDNIGGYQLFKEDNFNSFDDTFWDAGTATFNGNLATFRRENISFSDGKMIFTLRKENFNNKPYTGAELRTDNQDGFYGYGCYEVRMKSAGPSGTVSSFFGYRYNPWQEIDIEIVGLNNNGMLTNIYYNEGPEGAANNDAFQVPPFPRNVGLTYDASQEFHNYAFEWLPGEIRWYRDGQLVKVATVDGADPNQIPDIEMQIMMNLWVSDAPSFAGEVDDSNFPVQSEYDWVRLYQPLN